MKTKPTPFTERCRKYGYSYMSLSLALKRVKDGLEGDLNTFSYNEAVKMLQKAVGEEIPKTKTLFRKANELFYTEKIIGRHQYESGLTLKTK